MAFISLFVSFFKIGLFTIGGGYAMIPLIRDEIIRNQWISESQLIDFIGISETTPGSFAINIATFVGMGEAGIIGGLFATLGVILPSFIIILIVARCYSSIIKNKYVQHGLYGIRPVVIGSIFSSAFSISLFSFFHNKVYTINNINYKAILIFIILFFIYKKFKMSPVLIIAISAVLGILFLGIFN